MRSTTLTKLGSSGFSLVEMAIVLMIVALLLGGLLPTVSSQVGQRRVSETSKQLEEIKEALIGFAVVNGRLPCPASSTSNGMESFCTNASSNCGLEILLPPFPTHARCAKPYDGFVPAATLGITPVDTNGYMLDAWNNRMRYAVTAWSSSSPAVDNVFTAQGGMSTVGISNLTPDLLVCSNATAAGFSGSSCGANNALTSSPGVPAVIYSTGKNGAYGGTGADEAANLNNNRIYVSHTPTPSPNEFDDIMIWLSPNVLINRMVAAGKLP